MQQERRKFTRLRSRLTTTFKVLATGKILRALTRDIGGIGVCLLTEDPIEPGTPLEVEIKLPDVPAPITFAGEVVWSKPVASSTQSYIGELTAETGVKFVDIDPKARLLILQYAALNALPPQGG